MIDFPASPTIGQQFTAAGVLWVWDGAKWTASGLSVAYLPIAGGTMLGPIVLAADPVAPLQAATAQYADKPRWGDNRITNGDMRIDQRNNGVAGTAINVYTVDRWNYAATQTAKGTWQRSTLTGAVTFGFPYSLYFTSSSAYASLATDTFFLAQPIEADLVADFAWGMFGAQPVTLSFLVSSSLTGTFSGSLFNYPATPTRSYPFTFSVPTAFVWTRIVVTIPGDTVGPWVMSGNAAGVGLRFDLGSGANFRGPANAWAAGNYVGATGAVSLVATLNASIQITGVKLEIGSVATPYNRQSLAKSLADCQRYYQIGEVQNQGISAGAGGYAMRLPFPVSMRVAPTLTSSFTTQTGGTGSLVAGVNGPGFLAFICTVTSVAGTAFSVFGTWTAAAEL